MRPILGSTDTKKNSIMELQDYQVQTEFVNVVSLHTEQNTVDEHASKDDNSAVMTPSAKNEQ